MDYFIIATDDVDNGVKYDCLVAFMSDFNNIQKCWNVSVYEGEIEEVNEFPVKMIDSYYSHSVGVYSCKLHCPEYIKKELEDA